MQTIKAINRDEEGATRLVSSDGHFSLRFPNGRRKAVSLSYDDGSEHDRRLVAMLNAHGLRGSFNLNASTLGQECRVGRDAAARLYEGHEIAGHGLTHADLTQLGDDDVRRELCEDKTALEAWTGQMVRGFAYPFGAHDPRVERLVAEAGFVYARGIHNTGDAALPEPALTLTMTCHHSQALDLARTFLDDDSDAPCWLRIWGHSYEFDGFMTADPSKDWRYIEEVCRTIGNRDDLWMATMIDVVDYLAAARALCVDSATGMLSNPSPSPVWIALNGEVVEISR
jgi:peptidoglycan/xylan/chitin deacetylase (PgdA/CDA1 family)